MRRPVCSSAALIALLSNFLLITNMLHIANARSRHQEGPPDVHKVHPRVTGCLLGPNSKFWWPRVVRRRQMSVVSRCVPPSPHALPVKPNLSEESSTVPAEK